MPLPMLRLNVDAAKNFFFDRDAVLKSLDRATLQVHRIFGARVRLTARGLMRPGGKKGIVSKPGEPPRTHGDKLLKKFIFFAHDPSTKSLVIGPALLNGHAKRNLGKTVPETLECGGDILVTEAQQRDGTWSRRAMRWADVNKLKTRTRHATIDPRPYMKPSYEKNKPMLMFLWKDAMHKV